MCGRVAPRGFTCKRLLVTTLGTEQLGTRTIGHQDNYWAPGQPNCAGAQLCWCPIVLVLSCPGAQLSWCPIILMSNCRGAQLFGAELSGAQLSKAQLSWCPVVLVPSCLVPSCPGAQLSGAHLPGAQLSWCPTVRCPVVRKPAVLGLLVLLQVLAIPRKIR